MTTTEALRIYLTKVMNEIFVRQENLGIKASGYSAKETKVVVKKNSGAIEGPLYLNTNFKGIGRKPGPINRKGIKSISEWMKRRHIDKKYLWPIVKTIEIKGTRIYYDRRRGIDLKSIVEKFREEFMKNYAEALLKNK